MKDQKTFPVGATKKPRKSHEKRPNTVFAKQMSATKKPRKSHEKVTSKNITSNESGKTLSNIHIASAGEVGKGDRPKGERKESKTKEVTYPLVKE